MSLDTGDLEKIQKDLILLQERGTVVLTDLRRSHESLHKHLSELYLWWREANAHGNYLNDQYQTLNRKFKTVGYGLNFGPLLWLVWGNNNGLTNRSADRYSRALNAMHKEYESKPEYFKNDGASKLANFISQNGGITELAGYGPKTNDGEIDEVEETVEQNNQSGLPSDADIQSSFLSLTDLIDAYGTKDLISYESYIKTNEKNFSLLLVQKTDNSINVIDTFNEAKLLDAIIADNMRRRFDFSIFALRPLFELLQTQCLPKQLEGLVDRLTDKARLPDEGKKLFTAHQRVLYRPATNEFVLSPMNAISGVVSIAQPFFPLILQDCTKDVFLPPSESASVESCLLRDFNFNLYDADLDSQSIPHYAESNSASHVVRLSHRLIKNEFINLTFWPFYDTVSEPQDQVVIDPEYVLKPKWQAHIGQDEFKRINEIFIEKWLNSHANYLTRDPYTVIKVTFNPNNWFIEFIQRNDQFENHEDIQVNPITVSTNSLTVLFASKHFVPALRSLALLPITQAETPVQEIEEINEGLKGYSVKKIEIEEAVNYKGAVLLTLDDELLKIEFCTSVFGGSQHTIYIPTVDTTGKPSTKPFTRYAPERTVDIRPQEQSNKQTEGIGVSE